jgi:hypothetical protein
MLCMCRLYQIIKHKQAIISDWVVSIIFLLYPSLIYCTSVYHKYYMIDDNFRGTCHKLWQ